jgi:hypothetical protein
VPEVRKHGRVHDIRPFSTVNVRSGIQRGEEEKKRRRNEYSCTQGGQGFV